MNLTIVETKEAPLVSRKEVKAEATFKGATPSNADVAKEIAAQTKADESLVVVKHIYTGFGEQKAQVEAYVYESKEALDKIEPKQKKKEEKKKEGGDEAPAKEAPKEEAPKEEAPADAPAAEKPAEEKKEEAPAEEKKEEAKE